MWILFAVIHTQWLLKLGEAAASQSSTNALGLQQGGDSSGDRKSSWQDAPAWLQLFSKSSRPRAGSGWVPGSIQPLFSGHFSQPSALLVPLLPFPPAHSGGDLWFRASSALNSWFQPRFFPFLFEICLKADPVFAPRGIQPLGASCPSTAVGLYLIQICSWEILWLHSFQAMEMSVLQTGHQIVNNVPCFCSKRWHSVNRMAEFIRYPIIKNQRERQSTWKGSPLWQIPWIITLSYCSKTPPCWL